MSKYSFHKSEMNPETKTLAFLGSCEIFLKEQVPKKTTLSKVGIVLNRCFKQGIKNMFQPAMKKTMFFILFFFHYHYDTNLMSSVSSVINNSFGDYWTCVFLSFEFDWIAPTGGRDLAEV